MDTDRGAATMDQLQQRPPTTSPRPDRPPGGTPSLALWQLNLLRVGYFLVGAVLAAVKWPELLHHGSWGLAEGTVECLLVGMSVLSLLGLRYPLRMLPILLFEVTWKLLWLGIVAVPLWWQDRLLGATREQAGAILWVVVIIAVIPWRHVLRQYVATPGDPWRRGREVRTGSTR
jgi:hypothetical protein